MSNDITVSVLCTVYNHEKYLDQCLNSLVNQKTNFKYEIIVHDDASTDKSVDIIKKYQKLYPELIKPILQKENQYSKELTAINKIILLKARGKFFAFCEGDDYWIDNAKLQKQYDAISTHSDCKLCVHRVIDVNEYGVELNTFHPRDNSLASGVIESKRFVEMICSSYSFQTTSYFAEAELMRSLVDEEPAFYANAPVHDQVYLLYFGYKGNVLYINETMSCYRNDCSGSFSKKFLASSFESQNAFYNKMINMYLKYNKYTDNLFQSACEKPIIKYKYYIALNNRQYSELVKKEYKEYLKKESLKSRLYIYFKGYFQKRG